jgi:hypothetical protein
LIAWREDTSSSGAPASCRQCRPGAQGSASVSDLHKRWAEGDSRTATLGVGVGHHNRRTRQTVGYGALEDKFLVAQRLGTTPVIHHYLQEPEKLTTDHEAQFTWHLLR